MEDLDLVLSKLLRIKKENKDKLVKKMVNTIPNLNISDTITAWELDQGINFAIKAVQEEIEITKYLWEGDKVSPPSKHTKGD